MLRGEAGEGAGRAGKEIAAGQHAERLAKQSVDMLAKNSVVRFPFAIMPSIVPAGSGRVHRHGLDRPWLRPSIL